MKRRRPNKRTAAAILAGSLAASAVLLPACENRNQNLYGPPPEDSTGESEYDPSYNQNEDIYGPPEWFSTEDNENVSLYGPPEIFDDEEDSDEPETDFAPEDNTAAPLYGPPAGEAEA
ncbi:MAG: hypothetical protein IK104_02605 [Clostridia bacterium]|nr:hypothetical protein [Clostridia bacterium]